jgi:hypothetical protein
MFGSGDGDEFSDDEKTDPGYVSPFAHIPGLGDGDDEPGDQPDPKLDVIRKGLARARPNAPRPNVGFPEADAWERFGKDPAGPPSPAAGKRKQGRLSRLFKGRRDDDV